MPDTTLDQRARATAPKRRRRTDADRLADMQAELARLTAAAEAKAAVAKESEPTGAAPIASRARATRGRPKVKRAARTAGPDDHLDAELHGLVEGFVAALRDVIRRGLVEQARRRLSE
jgi:hypothetical protein